MVMRRRGARDGRRCGSIAKWLLEPRPACTELKLRDCSSICQSTSERRCIYSCTLGVSNSSLSHFRSFVFHMLTSYTSCGLSCVRSGDAATQHECGSTSTGVSYPFFFSFSSASIPSGHIAVVRPSPRRSVICPLSAERA